jgi:hypothetical protein
VPNFRDSHSTEGKNGTEDDSPDGKQKLVPLVVPGEKPIDDASDRKRTPLLKRPKEQRDWGSSVSKATGIGIFVGMAAGIGVVAAVFHTGNGTKKRNRELAEADRPLLEAEEFCDI